MLKKINGIVLIAADFAGTVHFYRDTLGLPVAHEGEGIIDFQTEGSLLSVLDINVAKDVFGADYHLELAVEVPDVDATYDELKRGGVAFLKPPADQPWGQRTADFTDPEGNIIEIYKWKQAH